MLIRIACACTVIGAYGYAAIGDYHHDTAQAEHYSEMVCAGHWPDYDRLEPDCEGDEE